MLMHPRRDTDNWARWGSDAEFERELRRVLPHAAVAEAVVALRAQAGVSQEELARRMGTTQSAISRLESGTQDARASTLNRVAEALGQTWRPAFTPVGATNPEPSFVWTAQASYVTSYVIKIGGQPLHLATDILYATPADPALVSTPKRPRLALAS